MQKESIGRLLLSLLTCFVLVAGVLGAADLTTEDVPSAETDVIAAGVLDIGPSDVGEAPTSAVPDEEQDTNVATEDTTETPKDFVDDPNSQPCSENLESFSDAQDDSTGYAMSSEGNVAYTDEDTPESHGTRYNPGASVEILGDYTGMAEGWTKTFTAVIHGDDMQNFWFRWDIDGDGDFETEFLDYPKGEANYTHTFTDDVKGDCLVQAWDGSKIITQVGANCLDEPMTVYQWRIWNSANTQYTIGWEFTVNEQITIDELGVFRDMAPQGLVCPQNVVYLKIYPSSGAAVRTIAPATPPLDYGWTWYKFSDYGLTPLVVNPGQLYKMVIYHTGVPYNYYPVIWRVTSSPDGKVNVGYRTYYPGDQNPTYRSSSYTPMVDFHYFTEEETLDVLEHSKEIYVENVAPDISCAASISSGDEGAELSFTSEFTDPGTDDEWWYRWDFGQGFGDWIKIPKYSLAVIPENVLYYFDGPSGGDYAAQAMSEIGITYTLVTSYSALQTQLTSGTVWDLVIVQNPYSTIYDTQFTLLNNYLNSGGKLILNTWRIEYYTTHPLWNNLGFDYYGRYLSPLDVYEWDTSHAIFNSPNDIPTLEWTNEWTARDGQWVEPRPGATAVAGYTTAPAFSEAALIARDDKQSIFNAFTPCNFMGDFDDDGMDDSLELFINEILWLLGGGAITPWPEAVDLPLMTHVFPDDDPVTLTPEDLIGVKVEMKDDDYTPPSWEPGPPIMEEDFETAPMPNPPAGWTVDSTPSGTRGWESHAYWYVTSGRSMFTDYSFYVPYAGGCIESSLISPIIDASGITGATLEFDHWWQADYIFALWQDGYVEGSIDGGMSYPYLIDEFHHNNPASETAHKTYDISSWADGESLLRIRFRHSQYDDWNWEVDEISLAGLVWNPGVPGLGSAVTDITIRNVKPYVQAPSTFVNTGDEPATILFEEFELVDPAIKEETEFFWYRWNFDDNLGFGDWSPAGAGIGPEEMMDIGPHIRTYTGMTRGYHFFAPCDFTITGVRVPTDASSDAQSAAVLRMYDHPSTWVYPSLTNNFDVLGYWPNVPGTGIIPADIDIVTGDIIVILGSRGSNSINTYGNIQHSTMIGGFPVTLYRSGFQYDLMSTPPQSIWTENSNIGRVEMYYRLGGAPSIPDTTHEFGDNGVYNVELQVIDDDMLWDLTGTQPAFTGTPGEEDLWISHNFFSVEVKNVDPEISPLKAEVALDLQIRVTGQPDEQTRMRLYDGSTMLAEVYMSHDGDDQIATLPGGPHVLDVGRLDDYRIEVDYFGTDGGANPTWIFQGRFSSGHTKELKHEFKSGDPTWVIGVEELRAMILGEDIVFTADGSDTGSDDLAFCWVWGDGTESVHIYANSEYDPISNPNPNPVNGVFTDAPDIFNAHPNRDPAYEVIPNDERSPQLNPIHIDEKITHAFEEAKYYYVCLIVMDDDVKDGYPSYQIFLNDGGYDMEFIAINLS